MAEPPELPDDGSHPGDPRGPQPLDRVASAREALRMAQQSQDSALVALRHAELGAVLAAAGQYRDAVANFRAALGFTELLRADGAHDATRYLRMTSLATPPPSQTDFDLDRFEVEVRVWLTEALLASGDREGAAQELQRTRPMAKGFFRRRLRHRLDRIETALTAQGVVHHSATDLMRAVQRSGSPTEQRALRRQLAGAMLDEGRFPEAIRESLLLIRDADAAADPTNRAAARQILGLALEGAGRPDDGREALAEAFRDLQAHGDFAAAAAMTEALAMRMVAAGQSRDALTILRTGLQAAERADAHEARVGIGIALGGVLDESGDSPGAAEAFEAAAQWAQAHGLEVQAADARHGLAVVLGAREDDDALVDALALLDQARRAYLDNNHPDRAAGCDHEAAAVLGRRGSFSAARSRYASALAAYRNMPEQQRDVGSWPDEVADCEANLAHLDRLLAGAEGVGGAASGGGGAAVPAGLFASGGHTMSHSRHAERGPTINPDDLGHPGL